MNSFSYYIPTKIQFGDLDIDKLVCEIKEYGSKILLVYGGGSIKKKGLYSKIIEGLRNNHLLYSELSGVKPNPSIDKVREGVKIGKEKDIDVILAIGGGSVIDTGKWIAAGSCVNFDPWAFFSEWISVKEALPIIAIPTIVGSGSEMDSSGVISNEQTIDKIGRSDAKLLPKVAFLDPKLTYTVPPYQTACGSIDIISHIAEVYFNIHEDFSMLDYTMEGMMRTVIKYTPIAMKEPENYTARANLMYVAPWAINGFLVGGKRQSWSSHKIEHSLSAFYPITHGEGMAIILVNWLKYCLNKETVSKYIQFSKNVFGVEKYIDAMEVAQEGIKRLEMFCSETLRLKKRLRELKVEKERLPEIANKAYGNRPINGFIKLELNDIINILKMSY